MLGRISQPSWAACGPWAAGWTPLVDTCYFVYGKTSISNIRWENQTMEKEKQCPFFFFSSWEELTIYPWRVNWMKKFTRIWELVNSYLFFKTQLQELFLSSHELRTQSYSSHCAPQRGFVFWRNSSGIIFSSFCISSSSIGSVGTQWNFTK